MKDQKNFSTLGLNIVDEAQTFKSAVGQVINDKVQLVYICPENIICNTHCHKMLLLPVYKEKLVALQ